VREEDAGGREAGAPSDLKMPLENGRADERVIRGQASERTVCVCGAVSVAPSFQVLRRSRCHGPAGSKFYFASGLSKSRTLHEEHHTALSGMPGGHGGGRRGGGGCAGSDQLCHTLSRDHERYHDGRAHHSESTFFVATDQRVHARYIMEVAIFTNCIAAILMALIYTAITVQKVLSCTLNDVSATLQNFVVDTQSLASGGESSGKQFGLVISFGSTRVKKLVSDVGVATCLSEDIRQMVTDMMAKARSSTSSSETEFPANLITLIGGFLSDVADTVTRTFAAWAFHTLDVGFAWLLGVVRGIQDVTQTMDWTTAANCQLWTRGCAATGTARAETLRTRSHRL
jgi:hypothetical protein